MPNNYKSYQMEWKQLYEEGVSLTEIGRRYGTSKGTVKNILKNVVEFRPLSPYEGMVDTWYDLYVNQCYSKQDIAIKYQTSASTVSRVLRKKGILPEKRTKARKYEHLLVSFIQEYKEGKSLNEIAKKHGVEMKIVHEYLLNEGIEMRSITEATRQYPIDETYFDVLDTDEKAYHLGIVFGKGSLHKSVGSSFLQVSVHQKRKQLLDSLVNAIQPESKEIVIKDNAVYRFLSIPLYQSLCQYGLSEHRITNIPKKRIKAFVKGYLSVKLYKSEKGEWRIRDKKSLLDFIAQWFSKMISPSSIFIREETEGFYSLFIYQKEIIKELQTILDL